MIDFALATPEGHKVWSHHSNNDKQQRELLMNSSVLIVCSGGWSIGGAGASS